MTAALAPSNWLLGDLLDRIRVRTRRDELLGVLGCIMQADLVDSAQLSEIRQAYEDLSEKVRELEAKEACGGDYYRAFAWPAGG